VPLGPALLGLGTPVGLAGFGGGLTAIALPMILIGIGQGGVLGPLTPPGSPGWRPRTPERPPAWSTSPTSSAARSGWADRAGAPGRR
jgi:hypothetical protein